MRLPLWESPLKSVRFAAVLVGLVGALVFANSAGNDFAYDDNHIVRENVDIHSLQTLPGALAKPYWPGQHGQGLGLWRPVMTGVLGLEWALWGETPFAFHVVNIVAHGLVAALVVVFLAELLPLTAVLFGGLIFAVHPVHVEAVGNVVGLAEVLVTGLLLLACLWHIRSDGSLGVLRIVGMTVLFAVAFLTKESAITVLGLLFLVDAARGEIGVRDLPGYLRRHGIMYGAMILVAVLILYARYRVLGNVAHPFAPLGADILEEIPRIWTVAGVWPEYVRLFFFPNDLVVDYAPGVIHVYQGWSVVAVTGVVLTLLFLVLALVAWRTWPMSPDRESPRVVGFAVVWFIVTISPVSNILFLSGILLAERTLYLPSVGVVAALGWVFLRIGLRHPRLQWVLLFLVLGLMGTRTVMRNPTWKDNFTVFDTLLREHPESGRGQWVLGDAYFQAGRVPDALKAYRIAVGIIGGHYTLLAEISRRLMGADRYDQAEVLLKFARNDRPEFASAPALLSVVYVEQGRWVEAEAMAREALERDDSNGVVHHMLAGALTAQERYPEAITARRNAILNGEGERWEQWLWLAQLHVRVGDTASALAAVDSARGRATEAEAIHELEGFVAALEGRGGS